MSYNRNITKSKIKIYCKKIEMKIKIKQIQLEGEITFEFVFRTASLQQRQVTDDVLERDPE